MEKTFRYLPLTMTLVGIGVVYCFFFTYFGRFPQFPDLQDPNSTKPVPITFITHFHALMMMLWILMLIVQPLLIIKKKIYCHRILGKASYLIFALLIISVILIVRQQQLREKSLPVFAANLIDPMILLVFYSLAIYYRKRPAWHARFMIMTIISFVGPTLARVQMAALETILGLFLLFFIIEWRGQKIYKPYLIGLAYFVCNLLLVGYLFLGNPDLLDKIWGFIFL